MTEGLQELIIDGERLQRVTSADLMGYIAWGNPLWMDHVLFDIPGTLAGAVRNADPKVRAITVHEHVVILHPRYAEMFQVCRDRGIVIVVARAGSFERVLLTEYRGDKPC